MPRPNDDDDTGDQQRDREQLTHCRPKNQVAELRVGLAKQLAGHAGNGIAGQEQTGFHARPAPGPAAFGDEQQQEQQDALAKRFIELARMARHRAAIWKDHRPGNIGRAAVKLAVDEIGDAAEEQADRDRLDDDVREGEKHGFCGPG